MRRLRLQLLVHTGRHLGALQVCHNLTREIRNECVVLLHKRFDAARQLLPDLLGLFAACGCLEHAPQHVVNLLAHTRPRVDDALLPRPSCLELVDLLSHLESLVRLHLHVKQHVAAQDVSDEDPCADGPIVLDRVAAQQHADVTLRKLHFFLGLKC